LTCGDKMWLVRRLSEPQKHGRQEDIFFLSSFFMEKKEKNKMAIPAFAGPTTTSIAAANVLAAAQGKPAGTYTSSLPNNNVVVANPRPAAPKVLKGTTAAPASRTSGGGGGGGGGGSGQVLGANTVSRVAADPYAKYGGLGEYQKLQSGFANQKNNIFGSALDAARASGGELRGSILDFVDSLRSGQQQIDQAGVNNELARRQGQQGVMGMVGRGIQSGGIQLANKNAVDSSAAEGIARAYGDIGRRQLSSVGQQYELGNRDVESQQANLDQQRNSFVDRKYGESKDRVVNNIVEQARNSLAALDASMLSASLPDRIAIEQEKNNIRNQVVGELAQYDQFLRDQVGSVHGMDQGARRAEAARLATAGVAPEESFDYTDEVPMEFQETGPFASELPIFTYRSRRQNQGV
jgi:hypothetical protein